MAQIEASMRSRSGVLGKTEGKEISLKLYQYLQTTGMTIRTLLLESNLLLQFKDGRYRYVINGMTYDHYNHYMGNQQRFYIGGNCKARGTMFEFQNVCSAADGARRNALIKIRSDRKKFLSELKEGIASNLQGGTDDDW